MSYLLKSLQTKKINFKNRLIMPPMATAKADDDGRINKNILDYYQEKSKGGYFSLIIIEHSFITQKGKASDRQISIAEDKFVDDLKKLSELIHKNGSKTIMQINHAGSYTTKEVTGFEPVGPSPVPNKRKNNTVVPHELTKDEIKEIVEDFKNSALRVKNAGFDGVEIHSCHGYLLSQFLSPIVNKRTDEYGGDINGRIKFLLEVVKAVKEAVGEDFPIFVRLAATDDLEDGIEIEDIKLAAKALENAGVDVIDVSGGLCGYILTDKKEQGYFSDFSKEIKSVVSIPVIVTGGITEVSAAEKILAEGKADLVGVGRAVLADSYWSEKAVETLK